MYLMFWTYYNVKIKNHDQNLLRRILRKQNALVKKSPKTTKIGLKQTLHGLKCPQKCRV